MSKNPENSYTDAYQKHTPSGYTIHIVCSADASHSKSWTYKPICYRGEDTIPHFIKKIHELDEMIGKELHKVTPIVMTAQDELNHASATECCLCKKPLKDETEASEHCYEGYRKYENKNR